ncbi:hypothetical protein CW304_30620 [Bacillus sp. UFRGS-B20]|nr:hypothetical protein CW304_30620 [Bacillus sp. UFRGS-B20]
MEGRIIWGNYRFYNYRWIVLEPAVKTHRGASPVPLIVATSFRKSFKEFKVCKKDALYLWTLMAAYQSLPFSLYTDRTDIIVGGPSLKSKCEKRLRGFNRILCKIR